MPKNIIPLQNIDRQKLTTSVSDFIVLIEVWRQPSDGSWYCSIESPPNTRIVSGRRIVIDEPISVNSPKSKFDGDFFCRSTSVQKLEPGITPWGNTHNLIYEF